MKQLTIKELAPYLPYGLKVRYEDCLYTKIHIATLSGVSNEGVETTYKRKFKGCSGDYISFKGNNNINDSNFKPILRSLSDLTKEIEHNGEKFVPIERLFEKSYPANKSENYYYDTQTNYIRCSHIHTTYHKIIYIVSELVDRNLYADIQQLHEWHFDIFGLIENGLAIDINTLK